MRKETMKKENKSFLKECLIIIIVGIFVNLLCFLLSLNVKAAGLESNYFPFTSGYNPNNINVNNDFVTSLFSDPSVVFVRVYSDPNSSYPNRTRYIVLHDSGVTSSTPFNKRKAQPYSF